MSRLESSPLEAYKSLGKSKQLVSIKSQRRSKDNRYSRYSSVEPATQMVMGGGKRLQKMIDLLAREHG